VLCVLPPFIILTGPMQATGNSHRACLYMTNILLDIQSCSKDNTKYWTSSIALLCSGFLIARWHEVSESRRDGPRRRVGFSEAGCTRVMSLAKYGAEQSGRMLPLEQKRTYIIYCGNLYSNYSSFHAILHVVQSWCSGLLLPHGSGWETFLSIPQQVARV
jgi:hypothetical protein